MPYKNILVQFDGTPTAEKRISVAARLAKRHDAHLIGLVLDIDPVVLALADVDVPTEIIDRFIESARQAIERIKARLQDLLDHQDCPTEVRVARCAEWDVGRILSQHARYADLLVLGQPDPTTAPVVVDRQTIEQVVLSSGRPVMIVPYIGAAGAVGEQVLVAWDAGREAARAVADAMPILEKAEAVSVLTVNPQDSRGAHGTVPGADIAIHLARHGIKVNVSSIQVDDIDHGDAVLSWIADHGTDLLVMGAYAHSRVREIVLGGMTRSILDHMTVPVIMAH